MDNKIKLSESEWKIMSVLWENEPMTITQLTAALKDETGWGKSTVITFLKRMEEKGAVQYEQGKSAKSFYTLIKRENVAVSETKSFLKRLYNGSLGLMVNSLIQQEALSDEDISELYDILKKAEENRRGD
ncbi:MAG: BlaI/MecI/CopY family transcriptional regulator [Oscillospiraceae bacterium]|nr:BlaI/MecI/CopY family transcriptional regulator [Oscillospiraceae bacterium]